MTYGLAAQAGRGTATVNADGSFSYVPLPDFNGADSFGYRVDDGNGGSTVYLVTVDVAAVNDAPLAADDVGGDGTVRTISGSVLGNDRDADGDALSAVQVSGPAHGVLTLKPDGSFVYVPRPGFVGTDSFSYRAHDGLLASNVATVTLTVNAFVAPLMPTDNAPLLPASPAAAPPGASAVAQPAAVAAPGAPALAAGDPGSNIIAGAGAQLDTAPRRPADASAEATHDKLAHTHALLARPDLRGDLLLRLLDALQTERGTDAGDARVSPAIRVEIVPDESLQAQIMRHGAEITAISVSVGATWWALRMSGLFASLLASLPAWRAFDPLPVLERKAEDEVAPWDTPAARTVPGPGRSPEETAA